MHGMVREEAKLAAQTFESRLRCFRSVFGAHGEAIPETRHANMAHEATIGNQTRVNSLLTAELVMLSTAIIACRYSDGRIAVKLQSVWRQALPCNHDSDCQFTCSIYLSVFPRSNEHHNLFTQSSYNLCAGHFYSTAFNLISITFYSITQQTCVSQPLSPLLLCPAQSLLRLVSFLRSLPL